MKIEFRQDAARGWQQAWFIHVDDRHCYTLVWGRAWDGGLDVVLGGSGPFGSACYGNPQDVLRQLLDACHATGVRAPWSE